MNDQTVSHYRILDKLGAGGMGVVYKAEDTRLGRLVALKFLPENSLRDAHTLERFKREARTASALDHPNICTIYEVDEDQGRPFIVMQLLEGQTLRERIGEQPVPLKTLLDWGLQITDALQAAHAKGIMHRDIKPANVFITERGQAKILDFGLAKLAATNPASSSDMTRSVQGQLTHTGAALGTVAYMSPEQARGESLDVRTDLFSFGVLLYEMATGKQAFAGNTWAVTVHAILGQAPVALNESAPGLPVRLQEIIDKALMKNRDLRYQSAAEIHEDLLKLKKDLESGKTLKVVRRSSAESARRKRMAALALGFVVIIALVAAGFWGRRLLHPHTAGPDASAGAPPASLSGPGSSSASARKSIAVLPFAEIAGDPKLTAFGRGLLENVAAKLSQLSVDHDLEIVPPRTLEEKKVTTLADARKEFGVTLVLSVTLERSDKLVRAAYSLTDAKSGKNLAGASVTAPESDLFTIEDQMANGVAGALQLPLRGDERKGLDAHATSQPEAYEYFVQGRGYLQEAFKPEAITSAEIFFKQALKLDPNYGQAEAGLGETYWRRFESTRQKKWIAPAQQACAKAVELGNAGAEGHMCLGLLASGTGQYQQATEQFRQAVQLEPANDEAYVDLAGAYQSLRQPGKAEETYQQVIHMRPDYWRGYNLLGAFYFGEAEYDKAEEMFTQAVAHAPDSYRAYSNLGGALIVEGKDVEGAQALAKSIAIRPTYEAYKNLAVARFNLRDFKGSVANFQDALKLDSSDYQVWGDRGEAYYYGGDTALAMGDYRKALALAVKQLAVNPHDATILADVAGYYSMLGDRIQALSYLDRSLQFGHGDKELLFEAALVYNQLQETGVSLEWLNKALAAGYSKSVVAKAPALDNLHENPRFQALMQHK
jgi:serine/threonine protein kinase/Tfp pilus assembly protein PilF